MFQQALKIATEAHKNQLYNKEPYIEHPKRVAERIKLMTNDNLAPIVAILHDVIEDTQVTFEDIQIEFGEEVAQDVSALTRGKNENYFDYIKRLLDRPRCRLVKIADLQENIQNASLPDVSLKVKGHLARYQAALEVLTSDK
jgi:guanosine-3',5'-bis(diphosphate) 3'-pyrophosphohydrolase